MATRDDKGDEREGRLRALGLTGIHEPGGVQVALEVVDPDERHVESPGERLILALLDIAIARGAREATLEVRLSNLGARRLYEKYGFRPVGIRPRYYSDDHEDALIMTTEPLADPAMVARLAVRRAELEAAPAPEGPG